MWDPFWQVRLYGKVDRYKNFTDPVYVFDASAQGNVKCNPVTSWSLAQAFDNLAENICQPATIRLSIGKTDGSFFTATSVFCRLLMPAIIDPKAAGLIIASVSQLIINSPRFWEFWRGAPKPEPKPEQGDASSSSTSINELDITHHHFDPWTRA